MEVCGSNSGIRKFLRYKILVVWYKVTTVSGVSHIIDDENQNIVFMWPMNISL